MKFCMNEAKMKVSYLGTGAAEGIPALFCTCEYCKGVRGSGKGIRSRAQVVIDGELSIDFPPDAFYHNARFGAELFDIKYLVVTHSHTDHFYAQDFVMRGYKYARELAPLDIFGNAEVLEVFAEDTRREMREDIRALIRLHEVRAFEEFYFGDWRAVPLKARHTSHDPFVYLLEKAERRVLHLTDSGMLPEEDFAFLEKENKPIDLITFDCTFLLDSVSESARHMSVTENGRILERLSAAGLVHENTKKVLTHFSHNSAPTEEKLRLAEKAFGGIAAYDGMTIEL